MSTLLLIYIIGAFVWAAIAGLNDAEAGEFVAYVVFWPFVTFSVVVRIAAEFAAKRIRGY